MNVFDERMFCSNQATKGIYVAPIDNLFDREFFKYVDIFEK